MSPALPQPGCKIQQKRKAGGNTFAGRGKDSFETAVGGQATASTYSGVVQPALQGASSIGDGECNRACAPG
jgi:hypothetical protein